MNLKELAKEIPYSWKVQTGKVGAKGGWCVAYIDARDVMGILDDVVGPEGWKDEYTPLDTDCGKVKCGLSVKVGDEWVTKEDVGTASDTESEKGAFSDAFKRAGVKWGIGRFLYGLEMAWVDFDAAGKPVDKSGKRIQDLSEYMSSMRPGKPASAPSQPTPAAVDPAMVVRPKESAEDRQKKDIANLVTVLGFQPKTPQEWQTCVKSMTGLDLDPKNYEAVIASLTESIKNKK